MGYLYDKHDGFIWTNIVVVGVVLFAGAMLVIAQHVRMSALAELAGAGEEAPVSLFADFKQDITAAEGRNMHVYFEPISAKLHGGLGHLLTKADLERYNRGDVLTDNQVDCWFKADYHIMMEGVKRHFPEFDTYPHLVQLAICNWLYQLGADSPNEFHRATAAIRNRDWRTAANEWLYSDVRTKRWSLWRRETHHRCEQESERLLEAAQQEDAKR